MSTALAIASVTAVLKDLLNNGLIDHNVAAALGDVLVSALPPDRINTGEVNEKSQLNLFMYQVTPNQGWRNFGLPSRDPAGGRLSNPPLALDLHYMLTAYGAKDLHTEILLGYGMQLLHETPVLTRDAIRKALGPSFPVDDSGGWPPELQNLFASGLADQVEQIKIAPFSLTTEEISRLWTAFQARYRPTAAYQVSVVLIESRQATPTPLPVRQRNIYVKPFKHPTIDRLLSQESNTAPALPDKPFLSNYNLVIEGHDLRSEETVVIIGGIERKPDSDKVDDNRITVALQDYPLSAGVQVVEVVQLIAMGSPPTPHLGISSNVSAFVLRPSILAISVKNLTTTPSGLRSATLTLQFQPAVGEMQRVILILNEFKPPAGREALAYTFAAPSRAPSSPPGSSAFIDIPITEVAPLTYIVRVQVDGGESPVQTDAAGMFMAPQVTIL
jgi:hypothetical protein